MNKFLKTLYNSAAYIAIAIAVAALFCYNVDWPEWIEAIICFFIGIYFGKQYRKE